MLWAGTWIVLLHVTLCVWLWVLGSLTKFVDPKGDLILLLFISITNLFGPRMSMPIRKSCCTNWDTMNVWWISESASFKIRSICPSDVTLLLLNDFRTVPSDLTLWKRLIFSINFGLIREMVLPESTNMSVGSFKHCPCTKILENLRNCGLYFDRSRLSSLNSAQIRPLSLRVSECLGLRGPCLLD